MTDKPGYNRTSEKASSHFNHIPQDVLEKKWGAKKTAKDIQDIHFSKDDPLTTTNKEVEDYIDKAEKQFHKERREEWMKGYFQNYISRNPKDLDLYKI